MKGDNQMVYWKSMFYKNEHHMVLKEHFSHIFTSDYCCICVSSSCTMCCLFSVSPHTLKVERGITNLYEDYSYLYS